MTTEAGTATVHAEDRHNHFALATWLFLRALGLIFLVAFASTWIQLPGLVGPHGILPAQPFFNAVREQLGPGAYLALPSLCWIFGAGKFLPILCALGCGLSLSLFAGLAPGPCLVALWACYLSLCGAGQVFFNFQWDALLLETTLLAVFLAPWSRREFRWSRGALAVLPEPPRLARWLLWWLLFRLMFVSGVVKLTSGDPTWRDLSALTFHYETQPLPTPLAWFVHQLPAWLHRASCAGMFAIELVAPFLLFAPRAFRHRAALLTIALMVAIALTGNYTYFNFLTIALCVLCLDDAWWARLPRRLLALSVCNVIRYKFRPAPPPGEAGVCNVLRYKLPSPRSGIRVWSLRVFAGHTFIFTALLAVPSFTRSAFLPAIVGPLQNALGPLRSFNSYGLFAVMTNPRPELIIEGSDDGRDWRAYEFPHKPGAPARRPTWVAPHQPRLDWQLWFAALAPPQHNRWMLALAEHLLRGTPDVLALLAPDPFPQKPPRFVRIVRYEYHFTDAATRARTGEWWRRTPLDFYLQPASLR
ncbi:MAG: lipase maturation factor family protein [Verrucomicrobia bacterium]|nr:lipase maturation factor family protein [Verrucomicrobiota bacterium]